MKPGDTALEASSDYRDSGGETQSEWGQCRGRLKRG
jgi:hypothetical protein